MLLALAERAHRAAWKSQNSQLFWTMHWQKQAHWMQQDPNPRQLDGKAAGLTSELHTRPPCTWLCWKVPWQRWPDAEKVASFIKLVIAKKEWMACGHFAFQLCVNSTVSRYSIYTLPIYCFCKQLCVSRGRLTCWPSPSWFLATSEGKLPYL